jgi:hypothetical protein
MWSLLDNNIECLGNSKESVCKTNIRVKWSNNILRYRMFAEINSFNINKYSQ